MERNTTAHKAPVQLRNRRLHARTPVDEPALLLLVHPSCTLPCQLLDLSLGGCRVRTRDPFLAGIMTRVEIVFKIRGVAFRLSGVTQWTDRRRLVGIRFLDMTERRISTLAELLEELDACPPAQTLPQSIEPWPGPAASGLAHFAL